MTSTLGNYWNMSHQKVRKRKRNSYYKDYDSDSSEEKIERPKKKFKPNNENKNELRMTFNSAEKVFRKRQFEDALDKYEEIFDIDNFIEEGDFSDLELIEMYEEASICYLKGKLHYGYLRGLELINLAIKLAKNNLDLEYRTIRIRNLKSYKNELKRLLKNSRKRIIFR